MVQGAWLLRSVFGEGGRLPCFDGRSYVRAGSNPQRVSGTSDTGSDGQGFR
jgi:hypothetical protein